MSRTQTSQDRNAKVAPAEPVVRIDSEVTRRVRQHARAHPKTEVCGVLIGSNEDGPIVVRASIEAVNAAQAGTHVTFTQDAWEAIYRVKDEHYPDERIVGWYHSHPGFGVFLSEHDLFIQQNFFSSPGQVAWVYDPHTDEEGCFGWVGGEIHRITKLSIEDRNGDGIERTPKQADSAAEDDEEEFTPARGQEQHRDAPPRWMQLGVMVLSHLSVLVLGFLIASRLYPLVVLLAVDPATGAAMVLRQGHVLLVPGMDKVAVPYDGPAAGNGRPELSLPGVSPDPAPQGQKTGSAAPPQNAQPAKPGQAGGHP